MATPFEQWQAAKKRVDLAKTLGPRLVDFKRGNPPTARCPFHDDTGRPNLALYSDNFRCFACGEHGDLVDWFEKAPASMGGGLTKQEALQAALREAGVYLDTLNPSTAPTARQSPPKAKASGFDMSKFVDAAHKALMGGAGGLADQARAYVAVRGIEATIKPSRLGVVTDELAGTLERGDREKYRGRLIVPFHDEAGRVIYFKARALLGQDPKYTQPPGEIPAPFNVAAIQRARAAGRGFVILAEGELDALSILAVSGADAPVVGLPGGNLKDTWAEQMKGLTVYVLMDDDAAGHKHRTGILDKLAGLGIRARALDWTGDDVNAYLVASGPDALGERLGQLADEADTGAVSDLVYVRDTFMDELDARATRQNTVYPTGLASFDAILSGQPDDPSGGGFVAGLHIVGGVPGVGKTAWLLQVAKHNAGAGRPVLMVSYEQPKAELWARIMGSLTGIPSKAFKTGRCFYRDEHGQHAEMPTAEYLRRNKPTALEACRDLSRRLRIVEGNSDMGRWTVASIKREAEALADAYGEAPLVMVDYLQVAAPDEAYQKRELREQVKQITYGLQSGIARDLQAPVVLISSLGRASYADWRDDPLNGLRAFKEAGEVEYSAYTATLLYGLGEDEASDNGLPAPGPFNPAAPFRPVALWCVKNREGEPGKALAKFYSDRGEYLDAGRAGAVPKAQAPVKARAPRNGRED